MVRQQRLEDRIMDAMVRLLRTSEGYLDDLATTFDAGLRRGTIAPMMALYRMGPLRVSELAEVLGLDRTTVTRHLDELEPRGLVARRPDERDRRAFLVSLTPEAEQHLDAMRTRNRQRIRQICADWTPEERQMFGRLLPRFAQDSGPVFGSSPAIGRSAAAPARR